MARKRILSILSEDSMLIGHLEDELRSDFSLRIEKDAAAFLEAAQAQDFDIALLDYDLRIGGKLETLNKILTFKPKTKVLMVSSEGGIPAAVAATKQGAQEFLSKPVVGEVLRAVLDRLLKIEETVHRLALEEDGEIWLLGSSAVREEFIRAVGEMVNQGQNLLLAGENGIDKFSVAGIIHRGRSSKRKKLVSLDLKSFERESTEGNFWILIKELLRRAPEALPEELCGTLFLSGFSSLTDHFQSSLAKFLETIPKDESLDQNVRIILAVDDKTKFSGFVKLVAPPLRDRKEDLPLLVAAYLKRHSHRAGRKVDGMATDLFTFFSLYSFPGNYCELENILKIAIMRAAGEMIKLSDIPLTAEMVREVKIKEPFLREGVNLDFAELEFEKKIMQIVLSKCSGDVMKAAQMLDIPISVLNSRTQELGVNL